MSVAFYEEHPEEAERQFLHLQNRYKPRGYLTLLERNPLQRRQFDLVQTIRAINITEQMELDPEIATWVATRTGIDTRNPSFRAKVGALEEYGVPKLVAEARRARVTLKDGPVQVMALKHRRGGCSTGFMAMGFVEAHFWPNTRVEIHAQAGKAVENILSIGSLFYEAWPRDEERFKYRNKATNASLDRIVWPHGSKFEIFTAGSKKGPRSFEADIYLLSEYAHYDNVEGINAALAAAGTHAWVFKESTANGAAGPFHDEFWAARNVEDVLDMFERRDFEARAQWSGYFRFFFSWLDDPSCRLACAEDEAAYLMANLDEHERDIRLVRPDLDAEQVKWRRFKLANTTRDGGLSAEQVFQQENPHTAESAFQSRGRKVFNQARLQGQLARVEALAKSGAIKSFHLDEANFSQKLPLRSALPGQGSLHILERPKPGELYIVSGDVAQGLETGDFSVLRVLRRVSLTRTRAVAMYRGKIAPKRLGDVATLLAKWYGGEAYVVIEVNGPGIMTNDRVVVDNRWPHIYERKSPDVVSSEMAGMKNAYRFGFNTKSNTKPLAVENMLQVVEEDLHEFMDEVTVREFMNFERDDKGRYGAPEVAGAFDDCVIAECIGVLAHYDQSMAPDFLRMKRRAERKAARESQDELTRAHWDSIERKKRADRKRNKQRQRAQATT